MTTSVKSTSNGFTIIEVVLVLAISSLLLLIAFLGQGATTRQARFRDSVEGFKAQMESVRNSVNNTVIDETVGCQVGLEVARGAQCIKFGQVVTLSNNNQSYTVQTLIADGPSVSTDDSVRVSNPRVVIPSNPQTINRRFRWGVVPVQVGSGLPRIAFVRHAGTGKLETHIINEGLRLDRATTYVTPSQRQTIQLRSPECYGAQVIFNDIPNSIDIRLDEGNVC